jgi:hypothetical protein
VRRGARSYGRIVVLLALAALNQKRGDKVLALPY